MVCGMHGVRSTEGHEAGDVMKWTKERPTKPGWYWMRYLRLWCNRDHYEAVEVYRSPDGLRVRVKHDWTIVRFRFDELGYVEWQGPITPEGEVEES